MSSGGSAVMVLPLGRTARNRFESCRHRLGGRDFHVVIGMREHLIGGGHFLDVDIARHVGVGAEPAVARHPFRNPGFAAWFGILEQAALDSSAQNFLEARARQHHIGVGCKELPITVLPHDELVLGVVEREPFGYGLDRLGEAGPRLTDFAKVRLP
jgi:hypothetical protein